MSNLTSTVPSAFAALYGLLKTQGQQQNPPVPVFHTVLGQYEPASYVMLGRTPSGRKAVENHRFEPAALGAAQYPQYEEYDLVGYASVWLGGADAESAMPTVMASAWALYQAVVMTAVVQNRGSAGYVLGDTTAPIAWVLPAWAEYDGGTGTQGDGTGGFFGTVEFAYSVKARITVT